MAISQGSNLINVVVHNGADSRSASLSAIILSHALVVVKEVLEKGGGGGGRLASEHLSLILWIHAWPQRPQRPDHLLPLYIQLHFKQWRRIPTGASSSAVV